MTDFIKFVYENYAGQFLNLAFCLVGIGCLYALIGDIIAEILNKDNQKEN